MKRLLKSTLILTILVLVTFSCKEECTDEFVMITVEITNFDGTPASFGDINLVRQGQNDTLPVTHLSEGMYQLVDDNTSLAESEDFLLKGYQSGQLVLSEPYTFGRDDCHVKKISGKNKIVLD